MSMIFKLTRIFFKEMFSNGDFFENVKTHNERLEEKINEHLKQIINTVGITLRGVF